MSEASPEFKLSAVALETNHKQRKVAFSELIGKIVLEINTKAKNGHGRSSVSD